MSKLTEEMKEQLYEAIDTGIEQVFMGLINPEDTTFFLTLRAQIKVEANLNTMSNEYTFYATVKHRMKEIEEFKVDDDSFLRVGKMIFDEAAGKFEMTHEYDKYYINCQVVYTPN